MATQYEQVMCLSIPSGLSRKKTLRIHTHILHKFKKIIISYFLFKFSFSCLFLAQLIALFLFSPSPSVIAIHFGGFFLTIFTFFVMLFYFQAKKPEHFIQLKDKFVSSCRRGISMPRGAAEHHLILAQHILHFVSYLHNFEYNLYLPSKKRGMFVSFIKTLSHFFHEDDVFKMKEIFYYAAIEEHVEQIRFTPVDLEVHASLANCYVSLARVYLNAKQIIDGKCKRKKNKYENYFEQKFQLSSLRAIEELNIINDSAPNDPWVHAQLAQCYHSLEMKKKEAQEYEKILEISEKDQEVQFRLSKIYFQLGKNSNALKLYEKLRLGNYKNADSLLNYYNSANVSELFDEINL